MEESNSLKLIHEDEFSEIFSQTVEDMKKLGTYKQEFSPVFTRYAEMRALYYNLDVSCQD